MTATVPTFMARGGDYIVYAATTHVQLFAAVGAYVTLNAAGPTYAAGLRVPSIWVAQET